VHPIASPVADLSKKRNEGITLSKRDDSPRVLCGKELPQPLLKQVVQYGAHDPAWHHRRRRSINARAQESTI